jgi:hypothetical protein
MNVYAALHTLKPEAATPDGARVLDLILQRIRALARRRILWLGTIAGRQHPSDGIEGLPAGLRATLFDEDSPEEEARFIANEGRAKRLTALAEDRAQALLADVDGPFAHLVETFDLDVAESDLLQVCIAAAVDPGFLEIFGFIAEGPHRRAPTDPLAARLCGHGREIVWTGSSPLARWHLLSAEPVEAGEAEVLRVDPAVLSFLEGRGELDPEIATFASIVPLHPSLPPWPVSELARAIADALSDGMPARVHLVGPRLSGRRTFAAAVADAVGAPLISIDAERAGDVSPERWAGIRLRADRQAMLWQCALAWYGLENETAIEPRPERLPLEFIISEPPSDSPLRHDRWERRITLPNLTIAEREELWARALPASAAWPAGERSRIAERYSLQIGEITRVAIQKPQTVAEVKAACRETSRGRLGELASLVDCPFSRADLHVADELARVLDEFLFEARERVRFWECERKRKLFPRGTGLSALMCGPPGTGKTMAAQVIAAELGLDLFRIDIAGTVNKYIGETSKNLRRVFARAIDMNAVLFFDEADSLFSKRTDVRDSHDRYANADTNYLLQLVEDYPGIALLATNKRQNMDEAFLRRLRYLMYFSRPDAAQRAAIWRQLVAAFAGDERTNELSPQLSTLAQLVDVTGAEIKNAALAAAFLARQQGSAMAIPHLLQGLDREMGNQGRSLAITLRDIERGTR